MTASKGVGLMFSFVLVSSWRMQTFFLSGKYFSFEENKNDFFFLQTTDFFEKYDTILFLKLSPNCQNLKKIVFLSRKKFFTLSSHCLNIFSFFFLEKIDFLSKNYIDNTKIPFLFEISVALSKYNYQNINITIGFFWG